MKRGELSISDEELIYLVKQHWGFLAQRIEYIDIGCAFAFILEDLSREKVFLKIHRKDKPSDPIEPQTVESLILLHRTLDDLYAKHHLTKIPESIKTSEDKYFHDEGNYIFLLSEFIAGNHPSYEPNELKSDQLASIFNRLHEIDIAAYPQIRQEKFNISYALGIRKWLNIARSLDEITQKMLDKLIENKELIELAISHLVDLQSKFSQDKFPFVLTHGDAHHFNILQNQDELFLLDWENLKIAPRERDLWHYDQMPLIDEYLRLNSSFTINYDLFRFYQLQRFLEDLRVNIEQESLTQDQKEENLYYFLYKRSWDMFYRVIKEI